MKNTLIAIIATIALFMSPLSGLQARPDDADTKKSLEMSRNMILAVSGLADNFKSYKGDFIQKDASGNSYYAVKGLELGTESQYVIVKPDGTTVLAAVYTGKDKEDKIVAMAFAGFTAGILTVAGTKDFSIEQDKTTDKTTLKYYLKISDINIASFSFDVTANSGTLLVAAQ